jgi:hypothetical protein
LKIMKKSWKEVIKMPKYDGTGPRGMGPRTGWGMGPCGGGYGWGRGMGMGMRSGYGRFWRMDKEDKKAMLQEEAKYLKEDLKEIEKELQEMEQ